jgi:murein DD-endopeptidase MepM/ murein hydrolase activator NlpD
MEENMRIFMAMFFVLCVMISNSWTAEYTVQKGDSISVIAKKTGCSIKNLAKLNSILPPDYVIRVGNIIYYIDNNDIELAQLWINNYLDTNLPDQEERKFMAKMLLALKKDNIKYTGNRQDGIFADEVLLMAAVQSTK